MKVLSKVCSVILIVTFFAAMFTVGASAAENYKYSTIAYFDKNGDRAEAIVAEELLTAKIRVKNPDVSENLMFTMLLYENNKLTKAECDTQTVGESATEYSATMKMPADITNVKVVSILWDSMKGMNAICQSSIFPGGSAAVNMIYLDDKPIADFKPETKTYTYPVEIDDVYAPKITLDLEDASAEYDVEISDYFPGESKIIVTSADGAKTEEYTIKYECDAVLAAIGTGVMSDNSGYAGNEPKFETNFNVTKAPISNRSTPLSYVDPRIDGYAYWITESAWLKEFNVKLNRPATLHMLLDENGKSKRKVLENEGWKLERIEKFYNMTKEEWDATANDATPVQSYDNRKQGWAYVDWRSVVNQAKVRNHDQCALTEKWSKYFDETAIEDEILIHGNDVFGSVATSGIVLVQFDPLKSSQESDAELDWNYSGPTGATSILVDGKAIPNFDPETYVYDVVIDPSIMTPPTVTCEVVDGAYYDDIMPPTEFPGSVDINVTNMYGEQETYTINYVVNPPVSNITFLLEDEYAKETNAEGKPVNPPIKSGDYQYDPEYEIGDDVYVDKPYAVPYVDESLVGLPFINGTLGQSTSRFWTDPTQDWISFDIARPATLHILKRINNVDALKADGFEVELMDFVEHEHPDNVREQGWLYLDFNTKKTDGTPSGIKWPDSNCVQRARYYKHVEAGKVTLPAMGGGKYDDNGFVIFIEYDGWEY